MSSIIQQEWNLKKLFCYITYRLIAKHLPKDVPVIGRLFHRFRRIVCRPLFMDSARIIGIGQGASFGNGCNIIM